MKTKVYAIQILVASNRPIEDAELDGLLWDILRKANKPGVDFLLHTKPVEVVDG